MRNVDSVSVVFGASVAVLLTVVLYTAQATQQPAPAPQPIPFQFGGAHVKLNGQIAGGSSESLRALTHKLLHVVATESEATIKLSTEPAYRDIPLETRLLIALSQKMIPILEQEQKRIEEMRKPQPVRPAEQ